MANQSHKAQGEGKESGDQTDEARLCQNIKNQYIKVTLTLPPAQAMHKPLNYMSLAWVNFICTVVLFWNPHVWVLDSITLLLTILLLKNSPFWQMGLIKTLVSLPATDPPEMPESQRIQYLPLSVPWGFLTAIIKTLSLFSTFNKSYSLSLLLSVLSIPLIKIMRTWKPLLQDPSSIIIWTQVFSQNAPFLEWFSDTPPW